MLLNKNISSVSESSGGGIVDWIVDTTYENLSTLAGTSGMTPGQKYRITDRDNVVVEAISTSEYQVYDKEILVTTSNGKAYTLDNYPGVIIVSRLSTDPEPMDPNDPLTLDYITDTDTLRAWYSYPWNMGVPGWRTLGVYSVVITQKCYILHDLTPDVIIPRNVTVLGLSNMTVVRKFTIKSHNGYGAFVFAFGLVEGDSTVAAGGAQETNYARSPVGGGDLGWAEYIETTRNVNVIVDMFDPAYQVVWQLPEAPYYYAQKNAQSGLQGGGVSDDGLRAVGYVLSPQEYQSLSALQRLDILYADFATLNGSYTIGRMYRITDMNNAIVQAVRFNETLPLLNCYGIMDWFYSTDIGAAAHATGGPIDLPLFANEVWLDGAGGVLSTTAIQKIGSGNGNGRVFRFIAKPSSDAEYDTFTLTGTAFESISAEGQFLWQGDIVLDSRTGDWIELEWTSVDNGTTYNVWKEKARSIYA